MQHTTPLVRVAVPSPLRRTFDYLLPPELVGYFLSPGVRVIVPFGRGEAVGVVVELPSHSDVEPHRLKAVKAVLDTQPLLPADVLQLLMWASAYYQYPPGEVMATALPAWLRQGRPMDVRGVVRWRLTDQGRAASPATLGRAPRQVAVLGVLHNHAGGVSAAQLDGLLEQWRPAMRRLVEKAWVEECEEPCLALNASVVQERPVLNAAQRDAVARVVAGLGRFSVYVVDGVTGSGKTEVYLHIIEQALSAGRQAMVLVPEIGLTPQLVARFAQRFVGPVAVLHSGLTDQERLCAWSMVASGAAPIVIGTRSAVFTPMLRPGVIILDEEHDGSYKQQDGFRYHARDLAVLRASRAGIPVILGSATPSLETLHNVAQGRYTQLALPERAGQAVHPVVKVVDVRGQMLEDSLSVALVQAIREHLARQGQVLLFLNRRGFAPTLFCHDCGWVARCARCDSHLTYYQSRGLLLCHHCAAERRVHAHCPDCGAADLRPVGYGTERTEQALQRLFPDAGIVRIDRDTTRRKGALQTLLDSVHAGTARLLVGTQMLAKGHHFPDVTLVGILDVDQGLFSADFRAPERMAQLIVQVSGRAGRAERAGEVIIQTHHPDHPLLRQLLQEGYGGFAKAALDERRLVGLPPFTHLAMLRAEAVDARAPLVFLSAARARAQGAAFRGIQLLGPVAAPMERRAGRVRAQLLLTAAQRGALQHGLAEWLPQLEAMPEARKVRWSLDVDPMDMF